MSMLFRDDFCLNSAIADQNLSKREKQIYRPEESKRVKGEIKGVAQQIEEVGRLLRSGTLRTAGGRRSRNYSGPKIWRWMNNVGNFTERKYRKRN